METEIENENVKARENFLLSINDKLVHEYKALLAYTKRVKPYKIVEVHNISNVPGETLLTLQVTNKNCILTMTAAEIMLNYSLNDFCDFHAEMIRRAAQGKLQDFLGGHASE